MSEQFEQEPGLSAEPTSSEAKVDPPLETALPRHEVRIDDAGAASLKTDAVRL